MISDWHFYDSEVEQGKRRIYHIHKGIQGISRLGHAYQLYDGSIQCDTCHVDVPATVLDVASLYGNVSLKHLLEVETPHVNED